MNNLQSMAQRIKILCDEKGISINKMLTESQAGTRTYHNMLAGSFPSADKLDKIADYLDVTTDYLLGRSKKNPMDITREEAKEIVRQTQNRDVIIINEFGSDGDNKSYEISKEDWEEIKELQRIIKQRVRQRKEKE